MICFSLGSRVRGNDVWLAGMAKWLAGMTGVWEFDLLGFGFRGIWWYSMGGLFCL